MEPVTYLLHTDNTELVGAFLWPSAYPTVTSDGVLVVSANYATALGGLWSVALTGGPETYTFVPSNFNLVAATDDRPIYVATVPYSGLVSSWKDYTVTITRNGTPITLVNRYTGTSLDVGYTALPFSATNDSHSKMNVAFMRGLRGLDATKSETLKKVLIIAGIVIGVAVIGYGIYITVKHYRHKNAIKNPPPLPAPMMYQPMMQMQMQPQPQMQAPYVQTMFPPPRV